MMIGCEIGYNLGRKALILGICDVESEGEVGIGGKSIEDEHKVTVDAVIIDMRNGLLKSKLFAKEPSDSENIIRANVSIGCVYVFHNQQQQYEDHFFLHILII